jgi:hypothetical protein
MQTHIPITQRPLFSLLHTSARPDQWRQVYDAWLDNCANPAAVEYVLVVDTRWGFTHLPTLRPQDKVMWNDGRRCCVDGWNIAAAASTGLILIVSADDQYPCENGNWDRELIAKVPPTTDFIIRVSSGARNEQSRNVMVMPIMSRPRYEKQGFVFWPEYESMFADQDLCESAYADGVVVDAWDLLFPHHHPVVDPTVQIDEAYAFQNRTEAYTTGEAILTRRRANEFGKRNTGSEHGSPVAVMPSPAKKETIAFGLPGEVFSQSWVAGWTTILRDLAPHYHLDPLFCWSSSVFTTRTTIWKSFRDSRPQPDWMLWMDDDNLVTPEQIQMLIFDLKANPEYDMAVGWCWCGGDVYDTLEPRISCGVFQLNSPRICRYITEQELMAGMGPLAEIGFSGFPVVLMRRSILSKLDENAFAPLFGPQFNHGFAGEDISFCHRAWQAGVKIVVDRRVKVPHLKLRSIEPLAVQTAGVVEAVAG